MCLRSALLYLTVLCACGSDPAELDEDAGLDQGACDVEEPCGLSFAGTVEGSDNIVTRERLRCTIGALAERMPGRYLHDTHSMFATGSSSAHHTLHVVEGGAVLYVRSTSIDDGEPTVEGTQRCRLKPASYFEACLSALDAPGEEHFRCAFGSGTDAIDSELEWFESCEPDSAPACD